MGEKRDISNSTVPGYTMHLLPFFYLFSRRPCRFLGLFFPPPFVVGLITIIFAILSTIPYTKFFFPPGSPRPQSSFLSLLLLLIDLSLPYLRAHLPECCLLVMPLNPPSPQRLKEEEETGCQEILSKLSINKDLAE